MITFDTAQIPPKSLAPQIWRGVLCCLKFFPFKKTWRRMPLGFMLHLNDFAFYRTYIYIYYIISQPPPESSQPAVTNQQARVHLRRNNVLCGTDQVWQKTLPAAAAAAAVIYGRPTVALCANERYKNNLFSSVTLEQMFSPLCSRVYDIISYVCPTVAICWLLRLRTK